MVKTYRLAAKGKGLHKVNKNLLFPKRHSMFTKCDPRGNAPPFILCGLPLVLEKVEPHVPLGKGVERDNPWATWMMIEPHNGIAPFEWLGGDVGPVLVYRPGGLDFGHEDATSINEFLSGLLDEYADGPDFNPRTWLNENYFHNYIVALKQNAWTKYLNWDLNILYH